MRPLRRYAPPPLRAGEAEQSRNPAPDADLFMDKTKRICLSCGMELHSHFVAACGLKKRCPHCGHGYPLGDCSD